MLQHGDLVFSFATMHDPQGKCVEFASQCARVKTQRSVLSIFSSGNLMQVCISVQNMFSRFVFQFWLQLVFSSVLEMGFDMKRLFHAIQDIKGHNLITCQHLNSPRSLIRRFWMVRLGEGLELSVRVEHVKHFDL